MQHSRIILAATVLTAAAFAQSGIPHLQKQGTATQLIVDGQPFLVVGGELHNSSSSDLDYMKPIWKRMLDLNFNTVLAGVSWELIEPTEGHYDFHLVDGLIDGARANNLRLIFLWFGSWKNGMSSYAPVWVKKDFKRFERVKLQNGRTVEVLSTLCPANWEADARAFAALMRHIREVDGRDHTVIMMQVENEVGVLGDSRDRSGGANKAFAAAMPKAAVAAAQRSASGTWEQVLGTGPATDEAFMAWNYASYVNHVAEAGKAEYPLPMYVNAWLSQPDKKPGDWPSGGPLPHVMDIWRAAAPKIDILSPDIYQPNFAEWSQRYVHAGNPLFIPEMRGTADGARNVFYAFGKHDAIGTSPFAVDSIDKPAESALAKSYEVIRQIAPLLAERQGKGETTGFLLDKDHPSVKAELNGYELLISLDAIFGMKAEIGYGLIIATGAGEFVGAGSGFSVAFTPQTPGPKNVAIAASDEGTFVYGKWIAGRRLNGDENDQGQHWRFGRQPHIQRCTVYRFE